MLSTEALQTITRAWYNTAAFYNIPQASSISILQNIIDNYEEPGRYYHKLSHIASLIDLYSQYEYKIHSKHVVILAILFHDIIYNPQRQDNEEESANLFKNLLQHFLPKSDIDKVYHYILVTKSHNIENNSDNDNDNSDNHDLKYFIDMDVC